MPSETVRRPVLAARLLAGFCIAAASLSASVARAQTNAEETVQRAMKKGQDGMYNAYNGVFVKWLPRFGDASAVALTKILGDKPFADADIPAILMVVRDSYDAPVSIEDAADREPRTSLFVLSSLSRATTNPETLRRIADTKAFVKAQYGAYVKAHPPE